MLARLRLARVSRSQRRTRAVRTWGGRSSTPEVPEVKAGASRYVGGFDDSGGAACLRQGSSEVVPLKNWTGHGMRSRVAHGGSW